MSEIIELTPFALPTETAMPFIRPGVGFDGPGPIGPSLNPIWQPTPPITLALPEPDPNRPPGADPRLRPQPNHPPTPETPEQPDPRNSSSFYRGMKGGFLNVYPELGENKSKLGVTRTGEKPDIETVMRGNEEYVYPKNSLGDFQGMSGAPDGYLLPPFRRSKDWGGTAKGSVWVIHVNDIGGDLELHWDSPIHGVLSSRGCITYTRYKAALEATAHKWTRISPGNY